MLLPMWASYTHEYKIGSIALVPIGSDSPIQMTSVGLIVVLTKNGNYSLLLINFIIFSINLSISWIIHWIWQILKILLIAWITNAEFWFKCRNGVYFGTSYVQSRCSGIFIQKEYSLWNFFDWNIFWTVVH